ncbi:SDR family oxidoreductase [Stenotrophomonas maltophilia]|nr:MULTISPECIES: SDR family oxidoreductase [Stenotrophomonas]MDH0075120.1 SDR family oxidoreductase [Stenotrophomonas maltophilia]MDH0107992.1 SDR family oxidoreductase [Stenotrophomonas maltophilia]MDH0635067.1 SDR family oxidoreductase [Stenotrophomonas maltophilia]MDH0642928.1 SDR family oxidoreductase [Stenotrophomonas maltophilia]MDH0654309.1 SDR family oxidoreductase [Stenotrophomonas maltophilia]
MSGINGKVAFITGASRGIGAATVRRLALEGYAVAFTFANSADKANALVSELKVKNQRVIALQADNANAKLVSEAVNQTVSKFGRLDVVVNNAGSFPMGEIGSLSIDDFDRAVALNIRGAFIATQVASLEMKNGGRIINIGSSLVGRASRSGISLYTLCKAAMVGFTKGVARDLGSRGITVNIVHPGSTDTDMNPADGPNAHLKKSITALNRYGQPEEVANMIAWLASEEAGFVTGSEFTIDGGGNA